MKHSIFLILLTVSCGGSDFSATLTRATDSNTDSGASNHRDSGTSLPLDAYTDPKPFDTDGSKVDGSGNSSYDSGQSDTGKRDSGSHVPDSAVPVETGQVLVCPSSTLTGYCTSTKYTRTHFPCNYTPANCVGSSLPHAVDVRCCQ